MYNGGGYGEEEDEVAGRAVAGWVGEACKGYPIVHLFVCPSYVLYIFPAILDLVPSLGQHFLSN